MPVSGKTIKTENWKSKRRQWFEMKRNYLSLNSAYEIHMMCVYAIRVYPTIKSLNKKKPTHTPYVIKQSLCHSFAKYKRY